MLPHVFSYEAVQSGIHGLIAGGQSQRQRLLTLGSMAGFAIFVAPTGAFVS
jgi:hypothetical protein